MNSVRRFGFAAGVLLALSIASPGAALEAEYDGIYGLLATTYGRGSFLVDFIDADEVRLTTALMNLDESTEYRLVLSKARCGRTNTAQKEVLRTTFSSDANGAAYRIEVVPWLWLQSAPVPMSARIRPVDGGPGVCFRADAFNRTGHNAGGSFAQMEYSRFINGPRRGLVFLDRLDGGSGRLSWSFSGLVSGDYRLVGSTAGCDKAVTNANRLYSIEFHVDASGIHAEKNQDIEVENDETHWVDSHRLSRIGGPGRTCARGFVTDLIIDP
jgi:hypothetical protein